MKGTLQETLVIIPAIHHKIMAGTSTTPELCGFGFTTQFTIQKPQMLFF